MEKQEKYELIKAVKEGRISKDRAVVKLGVTRRHVNRLLERYNHEGKNAFIHGNTGRKPIHALSDGEKANIVNLYNTKYYDATFVHATELMLANEGISLSATTLRKLLLAEGVLSPKAKRSTRKKMAKQLKDLQRNAPPKEQHIIENKIVAVENAHSRRPRVAYYGEEIQMDASPHKWFGSDKTHLHIAIDDYSGRIMSAYFDTEETLNGYYHLLYSILTAEGIPHKFVTDRRTVFEYKKKAATSVEDDAATQFGYACKQLGIDLEPTSVAQAKGRVERAFGTLQSRWPIEFRLAGITNIKEANEALPRLIKDFNDHFSLPVDYSKTVFVEQPSPERIDQILSVLSERTVDRGHCIRYNNKYYRTLDTNDEQLNLRPGTKGLVAKTFSGKLYLTIDDTSYVLDEIPSHISSSVDFDTKAETMASAKHPHIPKKDHPWRESHFLKHRRYIASKYYLEV